MATKYKYKIEASASSNIEWAKISLEGKSVYLTPNAGKTSFKNSEREVDVNGPLNIFCNCKGDTGIIVSYTVTNLSNDNKVLKEKKIEIGKADISVPRIGRWSGDVNAK
jgi:hypothetical protein